MCRFLGTWKPRGRTLTCPRGDDALIGKTRHWADGYAARETGRLRESPEIHSKTTRRFPTQVILIPECILWTTTIYELSWENGERSNQRSSFLLIASFLCFGKEREREREREREKKAGFWIECGSKQTCQPRGPGSPGAHYGEGRPYLRSGAPQAPYRGVLLLHSRRQGLAHSQWTSEFMSLGALMKPSQRRCPWKKSHTVVKSTGFRVSRTGIKARLHHLLDVQPWVSVLKFLGLSFHFWEFTVSISYLAMRGKGKTCA